MLEERNESGGNRRNLLRRHVHKIDLVGCYYREVGVLTAFHIVAYERAVFTKRSITLSDDVILLFLGSEIYNIIIIKIDVTVSNLAVGSLNKSELVDGSINTKRRYKSDVRTFRTLDRTETSVMCVMNVTHLESGTLT